MAQTLSIARKLWSFREKFVINDEAGAIRYECVRQGWITPRWLISRDGSQVASFKRKRLTWAPTWMVESVNGEFRLRRKVFSFRRRLMVQGGMFDGAELRGNLFDDRFELTRAGETLAQAREKMLTFTDRHNIDLINKTPECELLTAIIMTNLLVQKIESRKEGEESRTQPDE